MLKHFTAILILLTLLVTNAFFLTLALSFTPNSLIQNQSLAGAHTQMLNFLLTGNSGNLNSVLTPLEFSHIQDVRGIYMYLPLLVPLLICLTTIILKRQNQTDISELIKQSIIDLLIFILISVPFFNVFFIYFHKILFPQGNWAFPVESVLIQLYPEQFWLTALSIIILMSFVESIIVVFLLKKISKSSSLSQR